MTITDDLQADLSQLRDALEAFAFALNSRVIQKGHIVLPADERERRVSRRSPRRPRHLRA